MRRGRESDNVRDNHKLDYTHYAMPTLLIHSHAIENDIISSNGPHNPTPFTGHT